MNCPLKINFNNRTIDLLGWTKYKSCNKNKSHCNFFDNLYKSNKLVLNIRISKRNEGKSLDYSHIRTVPKTRRRFKYTFRPKTMKQNYQNIGDRNNVKSFCWRGKPTLASCKPNYFTEIEFINRVCRKYDASNNNNKLQAYLDLLNTANSSC